MIANPSTKQRFKTPQGCYGYNCNRCIHKSARPCQLATFNRIETSVMYTNYHKLPYKLLGSKNHSTKYNRIDI